MAKLTVRYYAGARAAAGVEKEDIAEVGSVGEALALVEDRHPDLARILPACSLLLDGVALHDMTTTVSDTSGADSGESVTVLDVLPPFAGG